MPAVARVNRAVVVMCVAQACAQIGAFGVAALLPTLIPAWSLSNTEAGWISGIHYAAYTLVVPLLSSLTDRVDPKRVYLCSVALAAVIGFSAALPYAGAAALVLLYAGLIWSDSSSLTAGSAGSAEPGRRGATLAVHSTLGYAGGFLGPLALGATLDLLGGASVLGWGLAFGHVTVALLLGALTFVWLRPADLAGDRSMSLP